MVKVREQTRQELIDEINQLRQQVIELQAEMIGLKNISAGKKPYICPVPYRTPIFLDPSVYPFLPNDADGTGDNLLDYPLTICQSEF